MTFAQFGTLVKKSLSAWDDDDASSMGAALAFYTIFSVTPLLVMVIAIGGMLFGRDAAQGHVLAQLRDLTGPAGAQAIEDLLRSADNPAQNATAVVIGSIVLLFGATSVFAELYGDLNRIWRTPTAPRVSGLWHLVRTRILSFGMILGIGFMLVVSLVFSALLAAAGEIWRSHLSGWPTVVRLINGVVSLATVTVAFAMIYKFLPRARIAWADVWVGAAATAALFEAGKFLIGLYVSGMRIATPFGAAGSMAVLMIWVYYSAQIFLLGAEFTWVYAYREGSHSGENPPEPAPLRKGRTVHTTEERKRPKTT